MDFALGFYRMFWKESTREDPDSIRDFLLLTLAEAPLIEQGHPPANRARLTLCLPACPSCSHRLLGGSGVAPAV